MSNAYQSGAYQKEESQTTETVDDLMLRDDETEGGSDGTSTASSVRDIASRIPESLSAIGRDISRTIERAISAKDDYVVAVKVSPLAQEKVDQLVAAGIFKNRAEAAGLAQGLAFGVMNTAWALGEVIGPSAGGALADSTSDTAPYLVGAALCAITLAATYRVAGRMRPRAA